MKNNGNKPGDLRSQDLCQILDTERKTVFECCASLILECAFQASKTNALSVFRKLESDSDDTEGY